VVAVVDCRSSKQRRVTIREESDYQHGCGPPKRRI
jgi:hypothetical protein